MTIQSVTDADYNTVITSCRAALSKGHQLNTDDIRLALAVVKDAISRLEGSNTAVADLRATWDTQIAILQAGGAGDISAEVDTAESAVGADLVAAETAAAAAPTYTASSVADG